MDLQDSPQAAQPHAPSDTRPKAAPLHTPAQLLEWKPDANPIGELCRCSVPLPPLQGDFAGPSGPPRPPNLPPGPYYHLRRWHSLGAFCYFSHALVAVPPPGWVAAAHAHGVPALGTFITEWDAGAAHCARMFGSTADAEAAASALAAIAAHHGFEGWLINIENAVEAAHIPNLLHFLRVLTEQMRQVAPGWSQVVWYDAVTTEGKLHWQNTLNHLNRPFFDACDAIWINYTWRAGTPARVAREAGDRAADVYMGIDCFGRGTYGGGGFRCDVAVRACLEHGLSAALFAVGWPYEGNCGPRAPACWRQRDALFWAPIERAWWAAGSGGGVHGSASGGAGHGGAAGGSGAPVLAPTPVQRLPLYTDFSAGCGQALYQRGRRLWPHHWYHLGLQSLQPVLRVSVDAHGASSAGGAAASGLSSGSSGGGTLAALAAAWHKLLQRCGAGPGGSSRQAVQAGISEEAVFTGGSSVQLSGRLQPGQLARVQLFPAAVRVPPAGLWVRLTAAASGSADMRLLLRMELPAASSAPASGAPAAGHPGTLSLELLPALAEAPGQGSTATAATAQVGPAAWSSGPTLTRAANSCDRAGGDAAQGSEAAVAAPGWLTWHYFVGPDVLAGAAAGNASAGAPVLAGVDLLLRGAGAGEDDSSQAFRVYLGELCIEAAVPGGMPAPPGGVEQLACDGLQVQPAAGVGGPAGSTGHSLAARLAWHLPAGGARCCHVWVSFADGAGRELAPMRWLGVACANSYLVEGLQLLEHVADAVAAAAVTFAVQPEGLNGLAQELAQASRIVIPLPLRED